jgi:polyisoprenoid-binding protein YceI
MRIFAFTLALFGLVAQSALAQSVSTDAKQQPSGTYQVDGRHTQVVFAIPHFGIFNYFGRFDKISGTLDFNANDPTKSTLNITIDAASVDTPSPQLVSELVAAPVFDTAHFPTATFKSTSIVRTGPNTGKVTGNLTLKGVTKPVTLDVTFNGGVKHPLAANAYIIGFHADTTIKRSDFNMTSMVWSSLVGDDVKLEIEALFQQTKE